MTPRHSARRGKRTWLVVAGTAVVVLAALAVATYAVLHSRYFAASAIKVSGQRHESALQIERATGLAASPPMITVDPAAVTSKILDAFPWVATATVTRSWPHTVTITLTERRPVAVVAGSGGATVLVDATGRRLGAAGAGRVLPRLEYPALPKGVTAPPGTLGDTAGPGLIVARTLPPAFSEQVATVQVDDKGWVTLHLTTPVTFLLGPATDLTAKYEDVAAVIDRTTLHAGDVVDVSVPQAMTVTGP